MSETQDASDEQTETPRGGDQTQYLTPRQVAALFQVTTATVTRWADQGKLPSIRTLGGHRRFPEDRIMETLHGMHESLTPRQTE